MFHASLIDHSIRYSCRNDEEASRFCFVAECRDLRREFERSFSTVKCDIPSQNVKPHVWIRTAVRRNHEGHGGHQELLAI